MTFRASITYILIILGFFPLIAVAGFYSDDLVWYMNNGDRTFSAKKIIGESFDGAANAYAVDLDGDGDLDVIGSAWFDGEVSWWEHE